MSPFIITHQQRNNNSNRKSEAIVIPPITPLMGCRTSVTANSTSPSKPRNNTPLTSYYDIKPLNLEGGQCIWCGKYGHKRRVCPLLK